MELKIRKAEMHDAEYLFNLANDPVTRKNSFSSELIEWESHINWLEQKLNNEKSSIYIITNDGRNIGTVKFKNNDDEVVIGVTVDPNYRGLGLGALIIEKGCHEYWSTQDENIIAYIKTTNKASKRIFEKANFKLVEDVYYNSIRCHKLIAGNYEL